MEDRKYGLGKRVEEVLETARARTLRYRESNPEKPGDLDLRRQSQIARQIEIINRLLAGESGEDLLRQLTEVSAEQTMIIAAQQEEISRLSRPSAFVPRAGSAFIPPTPGKAS